LGFRMKPAARMLRMSRERFGKFHSAATGTILSVSEFLH
jgi:hypothetical protein